MQFALIPHPDFPSRAVDTIVAEVTRAEGGLAFDYRLTGRLDAVRWPAPGPMRRGDRLWEHSCFEAFVSAGGGQGYVEFNFAPSGEWAAYAFDGYRADMRAVPEDVLRDVRSCPQRTWWRFDTVLAFERQMLAINLTTVIEAEDGTKSYWALAHAPGPPDFHNRDGFIATLPA